MLKIVKLIFRYVLENKIMSVIILYLMLSSILKITTTVDICIPCIWKTLFDFSCPGCGLTTAFINLVKMDFKGALESNWLIYILIPFGFYFVSNDFIKFKTKSSC